MNGTGKPRENDILDCSVMIKLVALMGTGRGGDDDSLDGLMMIQL